MVWWFYFFIRTSCFFLLEHLSSWPPSLRSWPKMAAGTLARESKLGKERQKAEGQNKVAPSWVSSWGASLLHSTVLHLIGHIYLQRGRKIVFCSRQQ
jgi:hypothetical protein